MVIEIVNNFNGELFDRKDFVYNISEDEIKEVAADVCYSWRVGFVGAKFPDVDLVDNVVF